MRQPCWAGVVQTTCTNRGTMACSRLWGTINYHPFVWTLIDALRQDNAVAETQIAKSHRGQPPKKRVERATIQLQERLRKICRDRATNVECEICCGDIECCCAHDLLSVVSETGYVKEN